MFQAEAEVCRLIELNRKGDIDGTQVEHTHFGHHPLGAPFSQQSQAIAFPYAQSEQSGRKLLDLFFHLLVGGRLKRTIALLPHVGIIGILLDVRLEKLN